MRSASFLYLSLPGRILTAYPAMKVTKHDSFKITTDLAGVALRFGDVEKLEKALAAAAYVVVDFWSHFDEMNLDRHP